MDHSYSLDPCLEQSILDTFEHTIRLHDGPDHYLGRHLQLE